MELFNTTTQEILKNPRSRKVIYGFTDRSEDSLMVQFNDFFIDNSPITNKEKVLFFSSLKLLVNSGVPFVRALRMLSQRNKNLRFVRIIDTIIHDMDVRGESFSRALAKYPQVFAEAEIKMIYAGEITGQLEETLNTIASQMEKNIALAMKIQSALMYPMIVIVAIFLAGAATMMFIVPQFMSLFEQFGEDQLPIATQILIFVSNLLTAFWWLVFPSIFAAAFWFLGWKRSPKGKAIWDEFVLNAPLISPLVNNIQTTKISGNFATLMEAGIPVIKALRSLRDIIANQVIADGINRIQIKVAKGMPIHQAFGEEKMIDPVISEILEVGERTGSIANVLEKLSEQYESEVDHQLKNLSTTIEPAIILVVGAAVVFLAMAILTPIFQMQELFANAG